MANSTSSFVTDNKNVCDSFHKGPAAGANSNNCDMWKEIFDNIGNKCLQVNVRWMPSHTKEDGKELPEGVSQFDVDANDTADKLAGEAARRAQLPDAVAWLPIYYTKLVVDIQRRLATILINLPKREYEKKPKAEKSRESLNQLLLSTKHKIECVNNRLTCRVCLNSFATSDPACKQWLKGHCVVLSDDAPQFKHIRIQDDASIHLGNKQLHSTHNVYSYRGPLYCLKCGAV